VSITSAMYRLPAPHGVVHSTRAIANLARIPTSIGTALSTVVGTRLCEVSAPITPLRVALTALATWATAAAANGVNDLRDIEGDRISMPHRPLPSGRLSVPAARLACVIFAAVGLTSAWILGMTELLAAAGLLCLGIVYSLWLKGTVLVGNATVAILAGSPILFGAYVHGEVGVPALFGAGLLAVFVLALEVLKTIRDEDADRAVGYITIATTRGAPVAKRIFRGLGCVVIVLAPLPTIAGATLGYTAAMWLGAIPLTVLAMRRSCSDMSDADIRRTLMILRLAWWPGLLALGLMV
jgi:geranylgeranylglycerol-phosphate geranylgeranyltransferase